MIENEYSNIIDEALSWLNTPYHSGARVKGVGVDCGQLLIAVYEAAGVIPPGDCEPGPYSPEWHLHRSEEKYLAWVQKYCDPAEGKPQPGDIAVFQYGRCVSHAGIVLQWPQIIHAYVGRGVILSDAGEALLCDGSGRSRLRGIYRPRRVET
jgi:cell wall-associated NlpC family hydrolase